MNNTVKRVKLCMEYSKLTTLALALLLLIITENVSFPVSCHAGDTPIIHFLDTDHVPRRGDFSVKYLSIRRDLLG